MLPKPEPACLVIADLSGYTGYLAGVELDHAQDILADLMQTVVSALRPPFKLAKLEGDAAFVYTIAAEIDGSLLQDKVEATYVAFRRRLRDIRQSTSCECNACVLIPTLDLKFIVHHGVVAQQKMAGRNELVGRDVIVAHRLLKNSVADAMGGRAYAFYTDACVAAAGMDPEAQGLVRHRETIDQLGEVGGWIRDLYAAWSEWQERQHVEVEPESAVYSISFDVPVPPQTVWEYMTLPGHRQNWGGATVIEHFAGGRRGAGARNHCMHGKDVIIEEILDFRPYHHLTSRYDPGHGLPGFVMTDRLDPLPGGGTRLTTSVGPTRPRDRAALTEAMAMIRPMVDGSGEQLRVLLLNAGPGIAPAADEAALPAALGRYVKSPVSSEAHGHGHEGHAH